MYRYGQRLAWVHFTLSGIDACLPGARRCARLSCAIYYIFASQAHRGLQSLATATVADVEEEVGLTGVLDAVVPGLKGIQRATVKTHEKYVGVMTMLVLVVSVVVSLAGECAVNAICLSDCSSYLHRLPLHCSAFLSRMNDAIYLYIYTRIRDIIPHD